MSTDPRKPPSTASGPAIWAAVGAAATMAAFAALIVAGVTAAGLFPATGSTADVAADRGVWMATQAWATPLGLAGLGVLFGLAIPAALARVRDAIDYRRTVLVAALPTLIQGADQ